MRPEELLGACFLYGDSNSGRFSCASVQIGVSLTDISQTLRCRRSSRRIARVRICSVLYRAKPWLISPFRPRDCTWKDTPTLGVCSRCADVSSMLIRQCNQTNGTLSGPLKSCQFSLPNGFHLNAHPDDTSNYVVNVTMNDKQSGDGFQPLFYANYRFVTPT